MKTRHFLMMATLAVGIAMTGMMMTSCAKEDNPVVNSTDGYNELPPDTKINVDIRCQVKDSQSDEWRDSTVVMEFSVVGFLAELELTKIHTTDKKFYKIRIPDNVKYDEREYKVKRFYCLRVFDDLKNSLLEIEMNKNVKTIDSGAFYGFFYLEKVDFRYVEYIGTGAFSRCANLKKVEIYRFGPLEIARSAFERCEGLTSVLLYPSTLLIQESAFKKCTSLRDLDIECSLEVIETETFMDCTSLKNVKLANGLKTIKSCAFKNCTSLEELNLPGSLEEIDKSAFEGCENLKKVIFHGKAPHYEQGTFPEGTEIIVE